MVPLFMEKSFHLLIKPCLLVATMSVSDGFVLGADLLQDFVEVLLGCSIHLHIDCASKLRPQCCQLLDNQEKKKSALRSICRVVMKQAPVVIISSNSYSWRMCNNHLCVILLEVGQLILQTLNLHLQVSLCQGGLVQQAAQVGDVGFD